MAKVGTYYDEQTSFVFALLGFFTAFLCGLLAWGDVTGYLLIPWFAAFLVGGPLIAGFLVGYSLLYKKSLKMPLIWSALTLLAALLIGNYMGALWLARHEADLASSLQTSTSAIAISVAIHLAVALGIGLGAAYYGYLRRGQKDYDFRMGLLPDSDAEPPTM
jgi:hypothetical protein